MVVRLFPPSSNTAEVKEHLEFQATVTFGFISTDVMGTGLWKIAMYGSNNGRGIGEHFQRINQTLSTAQQSEPLMTGGLNPQIEFTRAYGEIDLTAIGCGDEHRFLCFDFMKGDNPSPDFKFSSWQDSGSGSERSKFTVCKEWTCSDQGIYCRVLIVLSFLLLKRPNFNPAALAIDVNTWKKHLFCNISSTKSTWESLLLQLSSFLYATEIN